MVGTCKYITLYSVAWCYKEGGLYLSKSRNIVYVDLCIITIFFWCRACLATYLLAKSCCKLSHSAGHMTATTPILRLSRILLTFHTCNKHILYFTHVIVLCNLQPYNSAFSNNTEKKKTYVLLFGCLAVICHSLPHQHFLFCQHTSLTLPCLSQWHQAQITAQSL